MKYVFIMNPKSGKKKKRDKFLQNLRAVADAQKIDYSIYFTTASEDGKNYVEKLCTEYAAKGEKLRIYGCGGDGTLHEMVNGAFGYENVEIGAIPMGTGNDYVRNYGDIVDFLDIANQIKGKSQYSDLIKYSAEYNGKITEGYCANMFNIGFDCNVVDLTAKVKNWPFVTGSIAYLLSVLIILVKKKGADLKIEYDDGTVTDKKLLLMAIANGCYCGGGVKGVPYCELDDGLMDVSVVRNISRMAFISFFPSYSKGTHLEKKRMIEQKIIKYDKEKALTVTANGASLRLCTDGEITTQKKIKFSMVQNAFKFIVPQNIVSVQCPENR